MHTVSITLNGKEYSLETGRFAKLAGGAVMVRYGDTMTLVTVCASEQPRDVDFVPLTVEYREKVASAGKIPGGFFKREGKPSDKEVLSARQIDRPARPLFPKNWRYETQIVASVYSADRENDADTLSAVGASAALMLSDIPFKGPFSEVSVGRINGELIVNPTLPQLAESDMEITVAGTDTAIMMVEGSSKEISEEDFLAAMEFAHEHIRQLNDLQRQLVALAGKTKKAAAEITYPDDLVARIKELAQEQIRTIIRAGTAKEERSDFRRNLREMLQTTIAAETPFDDAAATTARAKQIDELLGKLEKAEMRRMILDENRRLDGRSTTDVRPISIEVGLLPRTHGSALFTRGETQSLTTVTLGTKDDEQMVDGLLPLYFRRFLRHYNFPPFSTGEAGRMTGVSRRETGHGNLAERALKMVSPSAEEFAYVLRIVSDILESNGSSSMATVCAGSLAMFDAGVPLKKAVSGIAMGLIKEGNDVAVLSDILGDEDFLGDMDFKVTGTTAGITAFQMDTKIGGISLEIMKNALEKARNGRLFILGKMSECLQAPRQEMSPFAPRITILHIHPDKIREVIGPGGKVIKKITEETGCQIDIEDSGEVRIAAVNMEGSKRAEELIRNITEDPEVDRIYQGKVRSVVNFGAFVEIVPGRDGLLHVSEIDWGRTEKVEDVLNVGDMVMVKVIGVDRDGKIKLSRRALIPQPEGYVGSAVGAGGRREREGGDRGRDRDRDRGRGRR